MSSRELEMATAAADELRNYGDIELKYLTAEFEPHSSAQRPDVVFRPDTGPNRGRPFVVELRMPPDEARELPTLGNLREHRQFIATEAPEGLFFALATTRTIGASFAASLVAQGITVLDAIESGEDLAAKIVAWSGCQDGEP